MSEASPSEPQSSSFEADRRDPAWWEDRYLTGDTPWDTGITPPEVVQLIQSGRVANGWALDLGCGSGVTSRYLAANGLRVVGLDLAFPALRRGARLASAGGLPCHFIKGRVDDLTFLRVDVCLAVDIGCFHSLSPAARSSYIRTLAARVVSGGYYLLYTFVSTVPDSAEGTKNGPSITLSDVAGFAPWFALRSSAYGVDRGRAAAWFLMQRA